MKKKVAHTPQQMDLNMIKLANILNDLTKPNQFNGLLMMDLKALFDSGKSSIQTITFLEYFLIVLNPAAI